MGILIVRLDPLFEPKNSENNYAMKSIINEGPEISEAYDVNTESSHAYFMKVKEWIAGQNSSIKEIDDQAKKFGNDALAFRIMLKFVESEKQSLNS